MFSDFQQYQNETFLLMATKLKNSFFAFDLVQPHKTFLGM
jgi:hypothetical protein